MNIILEIKCQYEVLFSTFYEVIEYKRQNKNTDKILIWMQLHVILSSFVGILLGKNASYLDATARNSVQFCWDLTGKNI